MATFRLAFSIPGLAKGRAASSTQFTVTAKSRQAATAVADLLLSVPAGAHRTVSGQAAPTLVVAIDDNATAATGTVTCVTVANNSTVKVGNVTLTGVTGTPSGQAQFKCGVSATADALALATCINAHTTLSKYFLASSALGVVTITCILSALGAIGNLMALTSSDGTNLAVVGFASGADDTGAQTYSF